MFPTKSKSHYHFGSDLFTALAHQGHDVTLISPYKAQNVTPNYKQVLLDDETEHSREGKPFVVKFSTKIT